MSSGSRTACLFSFDEQLFSKLSLQGAFDLGRIFIFKWTVNWRFLPEDIFVHPGLHLGLLGLHAGLLLLSMLPWWRLLQRYRLMISSSRKFNQSNWQLQSIFSWPATLSCWTHQSPVKHSKLSNIGSRQCLVSRSLGNSWCCWYGFRFWHWLVARGQCQTHLPGGCIVRAFVSGSANPNSATKKLFLSLALSGLN